MSNLPQLANIKHETQLKSNTSNDIFIKTITVMWLLIMKMSSISLVLGTVRGRCPGMGGAVVGKSHLNIGRSMAPRGLILLMLATGTAVQNSFLVLSISVMDKPALCAAHSYFDKSYMCFYECTGTLWDLLNAQLLAWAIIISKLPLQMSFKLQVCSSAPQEFLIPSDMHICVLNPLFEAKWNFVRVLGCILPWM